VIRKIPLLQEIPLNKGQLTSQHFERLISAISQLPDFEEACSIALANAKDPPVWLVGGKVYRTILHELYGLKTDHESCDFDFLTSRLRWWKYIPKKWYRAKAFDDDYGSPYFSPYRIKKISDTYRFTRLKNSEFFCCAAEQFSERQIDLLCFSKLRGIKMGKFPHTLEGYFKSVPLNIQAIALDISKTFIGESLFDDKFYQYYPNLLAGDIGLNAILTQNIEINYLDQAKASAQDKNLKLEDWLQNKRSNLGLLATSKYNS